MEKYLLKQSARLDVVDALRGFALLPVCRWSDKAVLATAVILLIQPFECYRMAHAWLDPEYQTAIGGFNWHFYQQCEQLLRKGNFGEFVRANITSGQLYSHFWQIENGRLFQVPALFMFGMLLGRLRYFVRSDQSIGFWKKVLWRFACAWGVLYVLDVCAGTWVQLESQTFRTAYKIAVNSYLNFSMMAVWVALFVLLWFRFGNGIRAQRWLIPYGRMSLTNYISQSLLGACIYAGFGLGWWQTAGVTACVLIGFGIFLLQWRFSTFWLSCFRQGPLEYVWKRLTWIGKKF